MTTSLVAANWREDILQFDCVGDRLLGILTVPIAQPRIGLILIPGGAQYRAGAHRQHVLLARALADQGIVTLRFEGRGLGDAEGVQSGFEALGPDIEAAVVALRAAVPPETPILLYGLCDAATAIALQMPTAAVDGAILLNPWIRSEQTLGAAQIRVHYPRQMISAEFWKKLLTGQINPWSKLQDVVKAYVQSRTAPDEASLADRVLVNLTMWRKPVLMVLSGRDMTAAEFDGEIVPRLKGAAAAHVTIARVPSADHTFSQVVWWHSAFGQIEAWLTTGFTADPKTSPEPSRSKPD